MNSIIHTVQPVPAPFSTNALNKSNNSEGGSNQNEILLSLGKAISGAPTCNGKKILPNPPINAGITIKKIIKNA